MLANEKIRMALAAIARHDAELWKELAPQVSELTAGTARVGLLAGSPDVRLIVEAESIALRKGRPVLPIRDNALAIELGPDETLVWAARLNTAAPLLNSAIPSIGRIELTGHRLLDWVGTGWLVAPDIVVTNRHVAQAFTRRAGERHEFAVGVSGAPMEASVDYVEELGSVASRVARLKKVLHVEDDDGLDMAFFQIESDSLARPIGLLDTVAPEAFVATVGYPARDSRIPDTALMDELYGYLYDKKRLAPGQVMDFTSETLRHNCTTLGGNSGSALLDMATGLAVALHFGGRFLEANYAVPAARILERLDRITRGAGQRRSPSELAPVPALPASPSPPTQQAPAGQSVTLTVPLTITLTVGTAVPVVVDAGAAASVNCSAHVAPLDGSAGDDADDLAPEARIEEYSDRTGYQADFISGQHVPLPIIERDADQIVTFSWAGNSAESELKYQHFSAVMHRARRMCFYSAVNIDGRQEQRTRRGGWRTDPRIPTALQIIKECYGAPPKFSRGHMTRREDPAWGTAAQAERGNSDSMHVTNAVPQMQTFNGGIWLGLEDYALKHARRDDMRISVLTGPLFDDADPVRDGVRIPCQFWKVIAFVHDDTGALSATGYSISQSPFLDQEFVFGAYQTHQRTLSWIEQRAGIRFGALTDADRFVETETAADGALDSLRNIQW